MRREKAGRKVLCAGAALTLALAVSGCGQAAGDKNDGQFAAIKQSGKLVIATEGQWAPWTYHDESGALVGFDVEVAQGIADHIGVEAEFIEGEWDGLFAGLDSGRYDIIANGVEWTEERAEKYDFSTPYGYIRTSLIVPIENEDIRSFEDLKGKITTNSIASTYEQIARNYGVADVLGVDTIDETINLVIAGRADATLNANVSFYDYMSVHPDAPIKEVAQTEDASSVVIPIRKGETEFQKAIDEAIEAMRSNGSLSEISRRYFGSDITEP